ncbi:anti-anti-sigma factor [Rivularia sp. PCC 7116]|uniref:STAS domain-containing protein n=1 Tax=Rivularia sp. PCC 7116 TaxID=373994 RepID=UPI00029F12AC|nr:STAS domain-containing protein [Rivularia sp. PCC 7116]AFY53627.1 anti-anti-sigma factor [Rivularia sp. PCC 7116]
MQTILDNPKITIICPNGSLDAANSRNFEQELNLALNRVNSTLVLINLEKVDFLDNTGLMVLVSGVRKAKQLGQRVCFSSVSPAHKIIFELAQLDKVFEIFDAGKICNR